MYSSFLIHRFDNNFGLLAKLKLKGELCRRQGFDDTCVGCVMNG